MEDRAPTTLLQDPIGPLTQQQRSLEVDINNLVKGALVGLLDRTVYRVGRCVVDDDVQTAIRRDRLIHEMLDILHSTHVRRNSRRFEPISPERLRYFTYRLRIATADDHTGTKFGHASGDCLTDPLAGSGNKGHLALKLEKATHF